MKPFRLGCCPLDPLHKILCHVVIRNPQGIAVALGCDGSQIFLDIDRNAQEVDIVTTVFDNRHEGKDQIRITTEYNGQVADSRLYDITVGVSTVYQEVTFKEQVALELVEDNRSTMGIRNTDLDR